MVCFSLQTVRFKNEKVRNITIKLGYANAKVSFETVCIVFFNHQNGCQTGWNKSGTDQLYCD